jgi:tetratricopeptide (TPR) repeat protein
MPIEQQRGKAMATTLGERIRQARKARRMTLQQVAGDRLSVSMLSRIETGQATPSIETLQLIADQLGHPLTYFTMGADNGSMRNGKQVALLLDLGEACLKNQAYEDARAYLMQAREAAEKLQLRALLARAELSLGVTDFRTHEYVRAESHLLVAREFLDEVDEPLRVAEVHNYLGAIRFQRELYAEARREYEIALRLIERGYDNHDLKSRVLNNLASVHEILGEPEIAIQLYHQALALLGDDPYKQAMMYFGLSLAYKNQGKLDEAADYAARSRELFAALENLKFVAKVNNNLGMILLAMGRREEALRHVRECIQISQQINDIEGAQEAPYSLARYYYERGEFDQALECAAEAVALGQARGSRRIQAAAVELRGNILRRRQDYLAAARAFIAAAQDYEALSMQPDAGKALLEAGRCFASAGDAEASLDAFMHGTQLLCGEEQPFEGHIAQDTSGTESDRFPWRRDRLERV